MRSLRTFLERVSGYSRLRHFALFSSLVVCIAVVGVTLLLIGRDKNAAIKQELERGRLLASVIEMQATRTLSSADIALDRVLNLVAQRGIIGDTSRQDINAHIRAEVTSTSFLRSIVVVDNQGRVLFGSQSGAPVASVDLSELGFSFPFSEILLAGSPQPYRDHGEKTRRAMTTIHDGYALPFAKAAQLNGAAVVLVAMVNPAALLPSLQDALGDPANSATLFDFDGQVLAATDGSEFRIGDRYSDLPILMPLRNEIESGALTLPRQSLPADEYVVNYRASQIFPVVALIALSSEAAVAKAEPAIRGLQMMGGAAIVIAVLYMILLNRMIAKRDRMSRELLDAKSAAEEANAARGAFLSVTTHEIRTPMNAVVGMIGLLQQTRLTPEQADIVRVIREGSDALLLIVDDVLDFARIDSGAVEVAREPFDPAEVMQSVRAILAESAKSKGLDMECQINSATLPVLEGDVGKIRQVLLNLCGNAIKFTHKGRVTLQLDCVPLAGGVHQLDFAVTDTGIGIEPAVVRKLFTPFTQADVSITRRYGGTGLGLAISKKLVEMMGGTISVDSIQGRGSTFRFELRLPESARKPLLASDQSAIFHHPGRERQQVLVVEDNPLNQQVALRVISAMGHDVTLADSGAEAIRKVVENRFDIILMDCQMPEMDGFEATRRIREAEQFLGRRTRIVAMTANTTQQDREQCMAAGMDDFLTKPMKLESIAVLLEGEAPALPSGPAQAQAQG